MKIYSVSEKEIDERLKLDKRHAFQAFCRNFNLEDELPFGFYDLQNQIRDGLENVFQKKFDDGIDKSHLKPWKKENIFFYFPAELIPSERVIIEISNEILQDKLVKIIINYLEKCPYRYCIIAAVYGGMQKGSKYIGRFLINLDEIVVEESLAAVWSSQMKCMKIETTFIDSCKMR